jgi:hypothetical protein
MKVYPFSKDFTMCQAIWHPSVRTFIDSGQWSSKQSVNHHKANYNLEQLIFRIVANFKHLEAQVQHLSNFKIFISSYLTPLQTS